MAYIKPAIQITLNDDMSFTVFISKDCCGEDSKEDSFEYDVKKEYVLSAKNVDELMAIMGEYAPKLKPTEHDDFLTHFNKMSDM